jgi:hypothetical protein
MAKTVKGGEWGIVRGEWGVTSTTLSNRGSRE